MKPPQSLAGYIRQHLPDLEKRLEVGIRQEVIVAELQANGYPTTTLKGFRNFLYRARQRAQQKKAASPAPAIQSKEIQHSDLKSTAIGKKEVPRDPLQKPVGFEYKGTLGVNEDDLI